MADQPPPLLSPTQIMEDATAARSSGDRRGTFTSSSPGRGSQEKQNPFLTWYFPVCAILRKWSREFSVVSWGESENPTIKFESLSSWKERHPSVNSLNRNINLFNYINHSIYLQYFQTIMFCHQWIFIWVYLEKWNPSVSDIFYEM